MKIFYQLFSFRYIIYFSHLLLKKNVKFSTRKDEKTSFKSLSATIYKIVHATLVWTHERTVE